MNVWGSDFANGIVYLIEKWGVSSAEKIRVTVLEMKCLRSMVGETRMDRVKNKEVSKRARTERELACI